MIDERSKECLEWEGYDFINSDNKMDILTKTKFRVRSAFDFGDAKHKASKRQSLALSHWKYVMNSDERYRLEVGI